MPFASKAQQRYAFATDQPWAQEFAAATPSFKKLPEHVAKKGARARAVKRIADARRRRS